MIVTESVKKSITKPAETLTDLLASQPTDLPDLPLENGEPVFAEPWHAQVFAMAVRLHEQGLFEWNEWSEMLGEQIKRAQERGDPDLGDTYYEHWLHTLENILFEKQLAEKDELSDLQNRWHEAALATPHGEPITIDR